MSQRPRILPVINYLTRGIIVVLGIALLGGWLRPAGADEGLMRTFGVVFVLFGLYRIATYYTAQKRIQREQERE